MRFAIYARVSSDIQSQHSTTDQIRQCETFISGRAGEVVEIYRDEAVSGADVSRTDYQRLKVDGYAGKFDAIVVDDLSRIGRDLPEFSAFLRDLLELDITLYGVADGIDSSTPSAKMLLQFTNTNYNIILLKYLLIYFIFAILLI